MKKYSGNPRNSSWENKIQPSPKNLGTGNSVKMRQIVCKSYDKISIAMERLKAGQMFPDVAAALSEDNRAKSSGGSLGWQLRDGMIHHIEQAAFSLPVSSVNRPVFTDPPIKTRHGYHIIMVEGRL